MLQTFYDLFNYCAVHVSHQRLIFFTHGEREISISRWHIDATNGMAIAIKGAFKVFWHNPLVDQCVSCFEHLYQWT